MCFLQRLRWQTSEVIGMREDDGIRIEPYDDQFGLVLNCAVRYAIGRSTYVPASVQNVITPMLRKLNDRTLYTFCQDIKDAKGLGDGSIDAPGWMQFLSEVQAERERRRRELHAVDAYQED